ncbi:MAG: protein translocase subunit SecD [Treponema sp.]|jgi:preprotein translocase subunit SecD|nr:protein translocase subunit SecD [Treponema sp.]
MSKRYRFLIVLLTIVVCFVFLFPSIRWYFMIPKEQQTLALESRDQIKNYSSRMARQDFLELLNLAKNREDVPEKLVFLTAQAKKLYREVKLKAPEKWDSYTVLDAFATRADALDAIETHYRDGILKLKNLQKRAIQLGLDLSGGLSIVLDVGRTLDTDVSGDAVDRALEILNTRIDRFGLTEPVIRRQGTSQIYVEIPGAADPERINDIIMGKGSLAFHIVDQEAASIFNQYYESHPDIIGEDDRLSDPSLVPGLSGDVMILGVYTKDRYGLDELTGYTAVKKEVGLDGNQIKDVMVERSSLDGKPEVTFLLHPEGGDIFYKLTSANVEKPLAIVLDDRVKSQATIKTPIRDAVRLTGFGADEANNIALILRTAALPVELSVANQQSIGASLGSDTIRQGLFALVGGLAAVMFFMLAYYKISGINAIVAQVLNIYLMLSILSAFSFTLTLPSIAGFILTIGMAVDANVIIFERMKEELRLGKGRKAVVDGGFDKAFWAIMDSNITTFIAALFLSQLGSGPIQGFAVTLAIGVFSSVFTSLFVSRLIFDFGTDVLGSKNVSVSWLIGRGSQEPVLGRTK